MSTTELHTDVVADGLAFGEGPRWHDGMLWFSDMHDGAVKTFAPASGTVERRVEIDGSPSGLGWLPNGDLLIVSMDDRRVLRWDGNALAVHADLSSETDRPINDMVVSPAGRAYVGGFGFDLHAGEAPRPTTMLCIEPDGSHRVVADDLSFPNGMVLTPDGATLVVGESFGARMTAFRVAADGDLSERRVWADLGPHQATPDGCCLDADGCIWVASPVSRACLRVREGGEVVERVVTGDRMAIACMLGDDDRRTLYVCTSVGLDPAKAAELRTGRIERARVNTSGAGLP
jgi:sugar lactone lactonase YvrE